MPPHSRELSLPPPPASDLEFEEIMNRNRAISSSAISKAVSGASEGTAHRVPHMSPVSPSRGRPASLTPSPVPQAITVTPSRPS